jgi:hypothetical protein
MAGSSAAPPSSPPSSVVTLEPTIHDTFAPIAVESTAISALGAWEQYVAAQGDGQSATSLPADITTQLGLLTVPSSSNGPQADWTYTVQNRLVWAYSSPSGCLTTMPGATPSGACRQWIFLDANTGGFVFGTFQRLDGQ